MMIAPKTIIQLEISYPVQYGNGESERNLGRILQRLKPKNVIVGELDSVSFWHCHANNAWP
jgi:hypothetical protein